MAKARRPIPHGVRLKVLDRDNYTCRIRERSERGEL
jgi:hypothetical protein